MATITTGNHSNPSDPIPSFPQSSQLFSVSNLDSLAVLHSVFPLADVSHSIVPSEFSLSVRQIRIVLAFIVTSFRHLMPASHFLSTSEEADIGIA